MDFAVILIATIVGCFALRNPLKALPVAFYAAAIAIDVVYVYGVFFGLPARHLDPLFVLIQKCELSLALFVVVMFIGCLNRGRPRLSLAEAVRSEPVHRGVVPLARAHGRVPGELPAAPSRRRRDRGQRHGAFVLAVVLLVLLVVLGVTSFAFVKRQMSTASWKKVQKLAYPFFGLVYVHLLLMLLPSALHGGLAAQASVAVYSVVFVGYALCRVGRALADKRAEDAVSASNDLTPAISDEPEMVS